MYSISSDFYSKQSNAVGGRGLLENERMVGQEECGRDGMAHGCMSNKHMFMSHMPTHDTCMSHVCACHTSPNDPPQESFFAENSVFFWEVIKPTQDEGTRNSDYFLEVNFDMLCMICYVCYVYMERYIIHRPPSHERVRGWTA